MPSSPASVTTRLPRLIPPTMTAPAYGGCATDGTRASPWTSRPLELCNATASSRDAATSRSGVVSTRSSVPALDRRRSGEPCRVMTKVESMPAASVPTTATPTPRATRRTTLADRAGVARPQLSPERRLLPAGLARALMLVIQPRIRKVHGDRLLATAVPQPQSPRAGNARAAVGVKERCARHAADGGLLRRGRAAMLTDAEMKVPGADIDREVAVEHRERRGGGETYFVGRALDHGPREDLRPVSTEDFHKQALDDVAAQRDVVVLGDGAVGALLHHARRHGAHGSANRRGTSGRLPSRPQRTRLYVRIGDERERRGATSIGVASC